MIRRRDCANIANKEMDSKKDKSFLAAIIAGFIGYKVGSAMTPHSGVHPEIAKLLSYIDEKLLAGEDSSALTEALIADASKKMGSEFNDDNAEKIRFFVLQEKVRLKEENKL